MYKNCVLFYSRYDDYEILFIGNSNKCLAFLNKMKPKIENSTNYWNGYNSITSQYYSSFDEYEKALEKFHNENDWDASVGAGFQHYHILAQKDGKIIDVTKELMNKEV